MSTRERHLELVWAVCAARFQRWERVYGNTPNGDGGGGMAALASVAFVAQLRELDDRELELVWKGIPTQSFEGQRNAWFLPTPLDLIDMARNVPPLGLAVQQFRRLTPDFLDSEFGRRMRVALLTDSATGSVPRGVHASVLQVSDDFQLQRAYQLALHWTRGRAHLERDRLAMGHLNSLPSARELIAEMHTHPMRAESTEPQQRHPLTETGRSALLVAAERFGLELEAAEIVRDPPTTPGI